MENRTGVCHYSCNLLAMEWMDKNEIFMLFTKYLNKFVSVPKHSSKEEIIQKPACIRDYNTLLRPVDNIGIISSTINSTRKGTKWYKKYFMYIVDMCTWNAYCLYKSKTGATISMTKFYLKLIDRLHAKYQKSRLGTFF